MSGFGFIFTAVSLVVASLGLWIAWRSRQELSNVKRERYYLEQKLKTLSSQIEASLEPLRIQVAELARGKSVSEQLIRMGRLYHEISASEAQKILATHSPADHILWLDVRTDLEFSKQHIPGAKLIPVEDLEMRYQTEIPVTVEKVLVYCAGGDRSRLACDFLSRQGFGNLYHIRDGLKGWTGPTEGYETSGLIQIASKIKRTTQPGANLSSSAHLS